MLRGLNTSNDDKESDVMLTVDWSKVDEEADVVKPFSCISAAAAEEGVTSWDCALLASVASTESLVGRSAKNKCPKRLFFVFEIF